MTKEPLFIALYGSYQSIELALYHGAAAIDIVKEEKIRASSSLIPLIDNVLTKNKHSLKDLDFIALDAGPGAFTSLRVIMSTINGIAHASHIPLVGIDGLTALAHTAINSSNITEGTLVCLLNAYNQEVYHTTYQVKQGSITQETSAPSYTKAEIFLEQFLDNKTSKPITFVGNGAILHQETIASLYSNIQHTILDISHASAASIATLALKDYQNNKVSKEIQPLYLKTATFAVRS